MRRNQNLRFLCRDVHLRTERADLPFTWKLRQGEVLRLPIAHGEGNYEDSPARLDALEANGQVVFRYCTPEGARADGDPQWNPNGAARGIAGVCNPRRQRPRHDAPPGARLRGDPRQHRRPGAAGERGRGGEPQPSRARELAR